MKINHGRCSIMYKTKSKKNITGALPGKFREESEFKIKVKDKLFIKHTKEE